MSIEEAISDIVKEILVDDEYCTRDQAIRIAEDHTNKVHDDIVNKDLKALHDQIDTMREQLDRVWNSIDQIKSPKHPKLDSFFGFKWLKFWK